MNATQTTPDLTGPVTGRVRVDERTGRLAARLEAGEIAVIDHPDLDRANADALIAARPAAVLNAARSQTGRHPVLGARLLVEAGILLVDDLGSDLMTLQEGQEIEIDGGVVLINGRTIATGTARTPATFSASPQFEEERVRSQVAAFAASAEDYLAQDGRTVFEGRDVPAMTARLRRRPILLVTHSQDTRAELKDLRHWIADSDPVVVVVDSAAEDATWAGLRPALVVGDMDLVPEAVLRSGAQLIVRSGHDGLAPGRDRLERMGLDHEVIELAGTAEDAATLVATFARPTAIVTVGQHHGLEDLLDRGRAAMAPTFFTRLSAQDLLVPAKAIAATHRPRLRLMSIIVLVLAMLGALGAALWSTPWGHDLLMGMAHDLFHFFGLNAEATSTSTN